MSNSVTGSISVCLVSSPVWCHFLQNISFVSTLIASTTGAIIGIVTLYRMSRAAWLKHKRT